jgi:MATE family multidrug resistance protein
MVLYGTVDILFVGRLGPEAIAAVGLASVTYFTVFVLGMGLLMGVDPLSSRAFGAGRPDECARLLSHTLLLALVVAAPLCLLFTLAGPLYELLAVDAPTQALALSYLSIMRWAIFPGLLFVACRQSLQSMNITRPLLLAIALGNVVNAGLDWALIPLMGVEGSAVATLSANFTMLAVVALAVPRWSFEGWRPEIMLQIAKIGAPGGAQMLVEVGVFAMVTALVGRMGAHSLAANQITLNLASVSFMIPMGLSHAAAVRVGQGIGRKRPQDSAAAASIAFWLAASFMTAMGLFFALWPRGVIGLFTADERVLDLGAKLLLAAAVFQVFDGLQAVLTGALRGAGKTKQALYANLLGHWAVGLPVGCFLAFHRGWGAVGLWSGLCVGLAFVSIWLGFVWRRTSADLLATS